MIILNDYIKMINLNGYIKMIKRMRVKRAKLLRGEFAK